MLLQLRVWHHCAGAAGVDGLTEEEMAELEDLEMEDEDLEDDEFEDLDDADVLEKDDWREEPVAKKAASRISDEAGSGPSTASPGSRTSSQSSASQAASTKNRQFLQAQEDASRIRPEGHTTAGSTIEDAGDSHSQLEEETGEWSYDGNFGDYPGDDDDEYLDGLGDENQDEDWEEDYNTLDRDLDQDVPGLDKQPARQGSESSSASTSPAEATSSIGMSTSFDTDSQQAPYNPPSTSNIDQTQPGSPSRPSLPPFLSGQTSRQGIGPVQLAQLAWAIGTLGTAPPQKWMDAYIAEVRGHTHAHIHPSQQVHTGSSSHPNCLM